MKRFACLSALWVVTLLACGGAAEREAELAPPPAEDALLPTETLVPVGPAWSYLEPGFAYGGNRRASVVAADRLGNVYVLASFSTSGGSKSSLIAFDPTGLPRWRRDFSAALQGGDGELDVATDFWGNVFIVGSSVPQLDLGGGPLGKRAFVAKFSSTGSLLWQRPLCDSARVYSVATDAYGAVWFGGTVGNGCNLGGGPLWEVTSWEQGFIAKFDALGEYVFSRAIGGRGDQVNVRDMTVTSDNGVVVVGGRYVFAESTQIRPYISKFASNGPHRWFRDYPEAYGDFWGAEVNGGRIVVVGAYSLNFTFQGTTYPATSIFGDGLVVAYSESGGEQWFRRLGCWAKAVSASEGQVAVLASSCSRTLQFPQSVDVAGKDGVLALYQGNGTPVRVRGIGQWHSSGWDVALSPRGAASVTGNENIQATSTGYTSDLSVFSLMP
ncbi:hypothetical protein [Melittangium boletus]|uniref:Lipoprotein n=1 Tax=Melittangium boletus DSM 14713 TaxID=1294270 RepID=A0A250INU0_9BACT|nr:hypothetical protein [Melittangium boletus]ATB32827.1 hypothetical protein MEBOL_006316 [Melittangium boletus DSM 14713]